MQLAAEFSESAQASETRRAGTRPLVFVRARRARRIHDRGRGRHDPQAQPTDRPQLDRCRNPAPVRIGRRVRIKRSDFDRVVADGYSGARSAAPSGIWDGEVPPPEG